MIFQLYYTPFPYTPFPTQNKNGTFQHMMVDHQPFSKRMLEVVLENSLFTLSSCLSTVAYSIFIYISIYIYIVWIYDTISLGLPKPCHSGQIVTFILMKETY